MKLLASLLVLLLGSACVTTERDTSGAGIAKRGLATPQSGWTTEFLREGLLIANEVRVVGPVGLRAHLATRFDSKDVTRKEKTVAEGYLQIFNAKPNAESAIGCYLDKLEIHATRRLTVLERPGPFDVIVEGIGDVYYRDLQAHQEQRVPNIRLVGKTQK